MKIAQVLILLLMSFSVHAYEGKYGGFELKVKDGVHEYEVRSGKVKLPVDISTLVNRIFGINNDDGWINSGTFGLAQDGAVVVHGTYSSRNKEIKKQVSRCDYEDIRKEPVAGCNEHMLLVVHPDSGKVVRLNTKNMAEFGTFDALHSDVWKYKYNAYGCNVANPIRTVDLDLDGNDEVIFIGGFGVMQLDKNDNDLMKTFATSLIIFDPDTPSIRLFEHELSYENFYDNNEYEFHEKMTNYQTSSPYRLSSKGKMVWSESYDREAPSPGIRRFSKLYFKDFDKNDKLDILVWQREYISRLKSDPLKGLKLNKVTFKLYEESEQGFVEKNIAQEVAEQYMDEYGLTWRDGYPDTNYCSRRKTDLPLIEKSFNERFNIEDPVLVQ
jgi:hypothetical protein